MSNNQSKSCGRAKFWIVILIFKCKYKQIYFETDDVIVGDVISKFLFLKNDVCCIDDSNCEWELEIWLQTKNCLNQSDDVTNVFDDVICQEF